MSWDWSPDGVTVLVSAIGMSLLAGLAWRRRTPGGAPWLTLVLLSTAVWAAAYSMELQATTGTAQRDWGDAKYLGICALPPMWIAFVSAYTGRARLRLGWMLLLAVEPVVVLVLIVNDPTHDLIRTYPDPGQRVAGAGPLFWPHTAYTYLVLWAGTALLVGRLRRLSPIYRRQSTVLVVSLAVPFLVNVLFNLGVPPFDDVDLTPFAFLGSAAVLVWGVQRFQLVGLRPIARSQVFSAIDDLVITLDPLHRAIDVNPAAVAALALPVDSIVGQHIDQLLPHARQSIRLPEGEQPVEERLGDRVFELHASPLTDRRRRPIGTLLLAHDVTERKDIEDRLSHQALHDPLTGAANRTLYFDRLTHALDHAVRTRRPVAVLFVDLDDFKGINDELGHAAGDAVLRAVAHRLQAIVRKGDTVARIGGDEFAILLEDVAGDAEPAAAVERTAAHVAASLCRPVEVAGTQVSVSGSVGVALGLDVEPDELVRQADQSMYAAKRARLRR